MKLPVFFNIFKGRNGRSLKNFTKNTLIIALGSLGSKSIAFFMLPIFTRVLLPSEYGKIDVITTTLSLLMPLLTLDMVEAVFRFSFDDDRSLVQVMTSSILIVTIGSLLVFVSAFFLPFSNHIKILIPVLFGLMGFNALFKAYLRSRKRLTLYAVSDIVQTAFFALGGCLFVFYLRWGIEGYLGAMVMAQSVSCVLILLKGSILSTFDLKSLSWKETKVFIKYTAPLIPTAISWWVMTMSDRYMISYFLGFSDTGIYSIACKMVLIFTVIKGIIFQSWQIAVLDAYGKERQDEILNNMLKYISHGICLAAAIVILISRPLMNIYVGDAYTGASQYIGILILGAVLSTYSSLIGVGYVASKQTGGALRTALVGAGINITVNLILLPKIGLWGATISTVCAYSFMLYARWLDVRRIIKFNLRSCVLDVALVGAVCLLVMLIK